jgi:hypothetical protein
MIYIGTWSVMTMLKDVRNDLKKMKLTKWTGQVQDRLKWKDIVEKAKTVPEL